MLEDLPIMLALCFMLWHAYYAQNYAGIIDAGLPPTPSPCPSFWLPTAGPKLVHTFKKSPEIKNETNVTVRAKTKPSSLFQICHFGAL